MSLLYSVYTGNCRPRSSRLGCSGYRRRTPRDDASFRRRREPRLEHRCTAAALHGRRSCRLKGESGVTPKNWMSMGSNESRRRLGRKEAKSAKSLPEARQRLCGLTSDLVIFSWVAHSGRKEALINPWLEPAHVLCGLTVSGFVL